MGRRGTELTPQIRSRICELRSLGWSYARIHEKHPRISTSTIGDTCRREIQRTNNVSLPRTGAPRKISEEQRDMLYDTAMSTPSISYESLKDTVATKASVRSLKRLF
jgi:hypothetical protein